MSPQKLILSRLKLFRTNNIDRPTVKQFFTARSELRKVLFLAPSVCGFLFVYEISREPLNRCAQNSQERLVWSLARTSLKVKVKGQGHQGQKRHFSALSAACVRFMFSKISLASS